MQPEPRTVVGVIVDEFEGRPGEIFQRTAVLHRLGRDVELIEDAVDDAESMGWVKPISSDYVELTRRGYVEGWLRRPG